jgi:hypothetical protein
MIHFMNHAFIKWLGTESNRRHMDFQSIALPTELPSHTVYSESAKLQISLSAHSFTSSRINIRSDVHAITSSTFSLIETLSLEKRNTNNFF